MKQSLLGLVLISFLGGAPAALACYDDYGNYCACSGEPQPMPPEEAQVVLALQAEAAETRAKLKNMSYAFASEHGGLTTDLEFAEGTLANGEVLQFKFSTGDGFTCWATDGILRDTVALHCQKSWTGERKDIYSQRGAQRKKPAVRKKRRTANS